MPAASPDNLPSRDVPLRHGPTLPPLHDRRTRTRLLLGSLLEAMHPLVDDRSRGQPADRMLAAHNLLLWPHGNYVELVRELDELRQLGHQRQHWHRAHQCVWSLYVSHNKPRTDLEVRHADNGVVWIARRMPEYIHVPNLISEEAGYPPAEAAAYHRGRTMAMVE